MDELVELPSLACIASITACISCWVTMELKLVINFLLHEQPHGSEELDVLPIVGPAIVRKSTLVAHVCKDDHDFTDDKVASTFREGCAMKHENSVSN